MKKEWTRAIATVVLGFALAVCWQVWRDHRQDRERTQVAMTAIAEELAANRRLIERNITLLRKDIEFLGEKKSLVQPLSLLRTGFWDVAKVSLRRDALPPEQLMKLRQAVSLTEQANEEIRSRETYRLHNGAMSNFHEHLVFFDGVLVKTLAELGTAVAAYEGADRQKPE